MKMAYQTEFRFIDSFISPSFTVAAVTFGRALFSGIHSRFKRRSTSIHCITVCDLERFWKTFRLYRIVLLFWTAIVPRSKSRIQSTFRRKNAQDDISSSDTARPRSDTMAVESESISFLWFWKFRKSKNNSIVCNARPLRWTVCESALRHTVRRLRREQRVWAWLRGPLIAALCVDPVSVRWASCFSPSVRWRPIGMLLVRKWTNDIVPFEWLINQKEARSIVNRDGTINIEWQSMRIHAIGATVSAIRNGVSSVDAYVWNPHCGCSPR